MHRLKMTFKNTFSGLKTNQYLSHSTLKLETNVFDIEIYIYLYKFIYRINYLGDIVKYNMNIHKCRTD